MTISIHSITHIVPHSQISLSFTQLEQRPCIYLYRRAQHSICWQDKWFSMSQELQVCYGTCSSPLYMITDLPVPPSCFSPWLLWRILFLLARLEVDEWLSSVSSWCTHWHYLPKDSSQCFPTENPVRRKTLRTANSPERRYLYVQHKALPGRGTGGKGVFMTEPPSQPCNFHMSSVWTVWEWGTREATVESAKIWSWSSWKLWRHHWHSSASHTKLAHFTMYMKTSSCTPYLDSIVIYQS